jgi:hypothetical protein
LKNTSLDMKKIHHGVGNRIVGAVMAAMICLGFQAAGQEAAPLSIKVSDLKGKARYSSDNKTWETLKKGKVLPAGTLIQTGDGSMVDLALGAASNLRIYGKSVLGIDKLTSQPAQNGAITETQLDLRSGQIMGQAGTPSPDSKYEIKFPAGMVGVQGGDFLLSSSGLVNVMSGAVVVAMPAADGSVTTKKVVSGFRFDPATRLVKPMPTEEEMRRTPKAGHGSQVKPPPSSIPPLRPGV